MPQTGPLGGDKAEDKKKLGISETCPHAERGLISKWLVNILLIQHAPP